MQETWLSNERFVSKSTPRCLTEQQSIVRVFRYVQRFFCPIIRNSEEITSHPNFANEKMKTNPMIPIDIYQG